MNNLRGCELSYGDHPGRCFGCGAQLPPLRRKWCSESCEHSWKINHVWSYARAEAIARTQGHCEVCRDPEDAEVHHDPPVGKRGYGVGCQHHQEHLHPLCHGHHLEADRIIRARPGTVTQLSLVA